MKCSLFDVATVTLLILFYCHVLEGITSCSRPPFVEHADCFDKKSSQRLATTAQADVAELWNYSVGSKVKYICKDGFTRHGPRVVTCQRNGQWSSRLPQCIRIGTLCPDLPVISNGKCRGKLIHPVALTTTTIAYENYDDYQNNQADNQDSESFYPLAPNLQTNTTGGYAKSWCRCGRQYQRQGKAAVTCLPNGRWMQLPACVPRRQTTTRQLACSRVPTIRHAICKKESRSSFQQATDSAEIDMDVDMMRSPSDLPVNYPGDVYKCQCKSGFYQTNQTSLIVCLANGEWTTRPVCRPVSTTPEPTHYCGVPEKVENADSYKISGNGIESLILQTSLLSAIISIGQKITFKCHRGYRLKGRAVVECIRNDDAGKWTAFPTCEFISCLSSPEIQHGRCYKLGYSEKSTSESYVINEQTRCSCQSGYQLIGTPHATCKRRNTWENLPRCVAIATTTTPRRRPCGPLPLIEHARDWLRLTNQTYLSGDKVQVTCIANFRKSSRRRFIKCNPNGRWSRAPECVPLTTTSGTPSSTTQPQSCHLPVIKDSLIFDKDSNTLLGNVDKVVSGSAIKIYCHPRYMKTPTGADTATCSVDGQWSFDSNSSHSEFIECIIPSVVHSRCGVATVPRIFGGQYVRLGELPWMAKLEILYRGERAVHRCGASLIDEQWLLTAAHCIDMGEIASVIVTLGRANLTDFTEEVNEQIAIGDQFFIHPNYSQNGIYNYDVALIKLHATVRLTETVRKICLPDFNDTSICSEHTNIEGNAFVDSCGQARTAGWGIQKGGDQSPSMKSVNVTIMDRSVCASVGVRAPTEAEICGGSGQQGHGTCLGDSGGPLICHHEGRSYVTGIVSHGVNVGCGIAREPTVFSRVCLALPWIRNTTGLTD